VVPQASTKTCIWHKIPKIPSKKTNQGRQLPSCSVITSLKLAFAAAIPNMAPKCTKLRENTQAARKKSPHSVDWFWDIWDVGVGCVG
jgi:hypothetical protein